jgi:hypothetical protein
MLYLNSTEGVSASSALDTKFLARMRVKGPSRAVLRVHIFRSWIRIIYLFRTNKMDEPDEPLRIEYPYSRVTAFLFLLPSSSLPPSMNQNANLNASAVATIQ